MRRIFKRTVCALLVALMCLTSAPLGGLVGLDFKAEATEYQVGDKIKFGSYPQSRVVDGPTINALNKLAPSWDKWISYGYYSGNGDYGSMVQGDWMRYIDITYNGNKYRGVKYTQWRPKRTHENFSDPGINYVYNPNTIYWFEFEPMVWRVLDPKTGFVMSETIIDSQAYSNTIYYNSDVSDSTFAYFNDPSYTNYASDYETSSIREWLNDDFYNTAFNEFEKKRINISTLDNRSYYTAQWRSGYEKLDGKATKDKVFLLSYSEMINTAYGFSSDAYDRGGRRVGYGSDYAKMQGLSVYNLYVKYDNPYMLRGAGASSRYNCDEWLGSVEGYGGVTESCQGVRPALRMNFEPIKETVCGKLDSTSLSVELDGDEIWISEVTVDGDTYEVKKGAVPLSLDNYKGKEVVTVLEDGEVVSCTPKEEMTANLSVSVKPYSTKISYKKNEYSTDKIDLSVVLTNILSSSFTGNKNDLENVSELQKVISTVKFTSDKPELINFNSEAEYKLTDLQSVALDIGKSCSGACTANINTKYKISDEVRSETVNIRCEVTYAEAASLKTIERNISVVFDNYNYEAEATEETEENVTNNQDSINITKEYKESLQKAAKKLKGTNALSLSYDLVNNGILSEKQLKLIEQDLLCRMVMSTVPPKDFDTWLSEKVMEEIFPSTSYLGTDTYDISQTYYIDSPEYGAIEITFTTTVSKYSFKDYGIASTGNISYEIKRGVPNQYKEGFAGGAVTANVDALCEAMSELMQSAIKSCYDKAWGDDANKVAEMVFDENVKKLISYSEYGTFSNMFYESMCYPTKKFIGKCPIDINVYDKDGNLCTSIKNNEIVLNCEKAKAEIDGDAKIIWLADEDYRIEIIALGDSSMDITVEEYANASGLIRTVNIDDIELEYGKTYSGNVEESLLCDADSYEISSSDSEIFEIDENINHLHSHILGEWNTVVEETCTELGKKTNECLTCERTVVSFVQPTGHTHIPTVTAPTCTTQGFTTYTCACGDSYVSDYVNVIAHTYTAKRVEPTCTENGKTVYTCACGDTYTETIKATGHSFDGSECRNCGFDKAKDCSCNCHKSGFIGFIWKIINFFNKLFKSKQYCSCGAKHW